METKILLALPILLWIVIQDLRNREINDKSWCALVLVGFVSFLYSMYQFSSPGLAAMFAVSLLGGMVFSLLFYQLEWWGGGDALVLIGMSVVTYNLFPFPLFIPILLIATIIGLFFSLLLPKVQGTYKDDIKIPFTLHLTIAFLIAIYIF